MLAISKPSIGIEEIEAVNEVLKSGNLVYGEVGREFEKQICAYTGAKYCFLVTSGTSALYLALLAIGISKGDGVLVPSYTFPATANVVLALGAVPILCDVDENSYCVTEEALSSSIEYFKDKISIKAVLPVHQFGCPTDMVDISRLAKKYKLKIVEDAACAIGAFDTKSLQYVGNIGDIGCFSFHPRKTITTGEGGAIITNNSEFANKIKLMRNHGMNFGIGGHRSFDGVGLNYRMSDIQAALGLCQFKRLSETLAKRKKLAEFYDNELRDFCELPSPVDGHSWQTYLVRTSIKNSELVDLLKQSGIEGSVGSYALHDIPFFKKVCFMHEDLNYSKRLGDYGVALPMCELYKEEDVAKVVSSLKNLLRERP